MTIQDCNDVMDFQTLLYNMRGTLSAKNRIKFDSAVQSYSVEEAEFENELYGDGSRDLTDDEGVLVNETPNLTLKQKLARIRRLRANSRDFGKLLTADGRKLTAEMGIRLD